MRWSIFAIAVAFMWMSSAIVAHGADKEAKANVQTIMGAAGCAKCNYEKETQSAIHVLCVKSGDEIYYVRPAPDADEDTRARITKGFHDIKGEVAITGSIEEANGTKWIAATSVKSTPKPEVPADKPAPAPQKKELGTEQK